MILYHMSQSLQLGDSLSLDHEQTSLLCQPFVQALEKGEDFFYGMILNGKYLYAVLGKSGLWEWANYAKWATEGAFEHVRLREYPYCISRLKCSFFYDNLQDCKMLFAYDWGTSSPEEQARVHLFEFETDDSDLQRFDMRIFDEAYEAMSDRQDVAAVLDCAKRYFAGKQTQKPIWEILSAKPLIAVKDVTGELHC